jgi:AP-1 complex subunit mu
LDVVEKLNILVSSNGTVLRSEILGALRMKSFLSGMPELKLGLNDKVLMDSHARTAAAVTGGGSGASSAASSGNSKGKSVDLEDIRFHQCVRLSRFETDRTISFIPPDGEFDLMVYRLTTAVRPLIWIEAHVEPHSHSRIEYLIKAKSNFKRRSTANNVEILIPVPPDADSPSFKTSIGKVEYVPDKDCIIWRIKQFQGQKEFLMRAHFGLPSISSEDLAIHTGKAPMSVNFEIPYFTVSGIQVRYLKIIEKSGYQALPWVRYITQNGDYQIRMT